jgi:outer membrane receptor protein involved in Fe transport
LQAQLTWKDRIYFTAPNDPTSSVPGYALLNARASLKLRDGKTEIYVFGKNLTDKTYLISNFPGSPSYPGYGATADVLYGAPRMIGAGVTRSF